METGLALAMTIGTLMSSFSSMFTPVWASLAPFWEKEAEKCNPGRFALLNWIMEGVRGLPQTIVCFFALAYGVNGLQAFLDACPVFIMTGLFLFHLLHRFLISRCQQYLKFTDVSN